MPSNWLYIDTNFPTFTGEETANEKIETVQNYLFLLVEQLRYTLRNLDLSNMNQTAKERWESAITEPIYAKIADTDENVNELNITAQGLSARLSDAESDITELGVTAQGLAARMSTAEGNITSLSATASGLQARMSTAEGNITTLTATANGLQTQVNGKIGASQAQTLINQSMDKITLSATSGDSGTVFKLSYDGAQIASTGSLDICVDAVNIYGTLTAEELEGDTITVRNSAGKRCGYISTDYASTSDYKMTLDSKAIEVNASSGALYLSGWGSALQLYTYVSCEGDFAPNRDGRYNLGDSSLCWAAVYADTGEVSTSDAKCKHDIEALPEKYVKLLDALTPKRFKLDNGTSGRYHTGFIAQDVEQAMAECGIDSTEFGGFVKDAKTGRYALRYSEFTALLLAKVREQDERIKRLEGTA